MKPTLMRCLCAVAALWATSLGGGCAGETRTLNEVRRSGEFALQNQDYERAAADFREYIDRAPGPSYGHLMLGRAYIGAGKPAMGREQLEIAMTNDPNNPQVVEAMCDALAGDQEYDTLFRMLRQRTARNPNASDFMLLGKYSQAAGDSDAAQAAYLSAVRADAGRHVAPQIALSRFYESIGDREQAVNRARAAYGISPTSDAAIARLRELGLTPGPGVGIAAPETP